MFKKALGKAAAGTIVASGLFLVPTAATVAPQLSNVACRYNDTVTTYANLSLAKYVGSAGSSNSARVQVSSNAGTPVGYVTLLVNGVRYKKRVNGGGIATFTFGKNLQAGKTYTVKAWFDGKCRFRNASDTAYYTVQGKRRS